MPQEDRAEMFISSKHILKHALFDSILEIKGEEKGKVQIKGRIPWLFDNNNNPNIYVEFPLCMLA